LGPSPDKKQLVIAKLHENMQTILHIGQLTFVAWIQARVNQLLFLAKEKDSLWIC